MTFVHYATPDGISDVEGRRFLDNVSVDGPIPVMVRDSAAALLRNMSRHAVITAVGRRDQWEYPPDALRELIVNALVHRDLSPGSRGTQVQVERYPDRMRILNPGGLFGAVDVDHLAKPHSPRSPPTWDSPKRTLHTGSASCVPTARSSQPKI